MSKVKCHFGRHLTLCWPSYGSNNEEPIEGLTGKGFNHSRPLKLSLPLTLDAGSGSGLVRSSIWQTKMSNALDFWVNV